MDDVRWFASNAYTALIVPGAPAPRARASRPRATGPRASRWRCRGLGAEAAWRCARAHAARDCWSTSGTCRRAAPARGRPDPVWWIAGRVSPPAAPVGRLRPAAGLLQPPALHRGAGGRGVGAERDDARDRRRAVRRPGRAGAVLLRLESVRAASPGATAPSPPMLLTVSRLGRTRIRRPCCAAAALWRPVQVRLIGRGPEQAALESLAAALGVACRVETDGGRRGGRRAPIARPRSRSVPAGSRASA